MRWVEIYRAVYHFVRPYRGLHIVLSDPHLCRQGHCYRRYVLRTPAMAAGITNSIWSMEQLLLHPAPCKMLPKHQVPRLAPVR